MTSLEDLSPELKSGIIDQITDLQTLKTIVRASPSFHRVYLSRRHDILKRVIKDDLGEAILPEALAVITSFLPDTLTPLRDVFVYVQLDSLVLGGFYEQFTKQFVIDKLESDQVEEMVALHLAVEDFARRFCNFALYRLSSFKAIEYRKLSPTERCRLLRAIYRIQFFNSLSRLTNEGAVKDTDAPSPVGNMDAKKVFLDLLPQWQREELDCVRIFLLVYHELAFEGSKHAEKESHKNRPQEDYEENSTYLLQTAVTLKITNADLSEVLYNRLTELYIRKKLKRLHRTSKADPMVQIRSLADQLKSTHASTSRILRYGIEIADHKDGPAFDGDRIDAPNSAWSWVRDYQYEPRHTCLTWLRQSGYVFWDEKRIKDWNMTINTFRV